MNYNTALVQLPLVCESTGERVRTPEDVYRVCRDIADLAQESFHVLALNAKNHLINRSLVTLGLADACLVHSREVFLTAIRAGSSAIICAHNHPSSDVTPSAEDIRITRQLIEAGRIIDIKVLDHVIIGRPGPEGQPAFMSMRENGLCDFT